MTLRIILGVLVGAAIAVSIVLFFNIQNENLQLIIGMLCGMTSTIITLNIGVWK